MSDNKSSGGCCNFRDRDVKTVRRWVQIANIINALFLMVAGVLTFILLTLDVLTVMAALYIICFGLLILMFEVRIKYFEASISRLFGFMFSPYGRLCFYVFCGTLAFALGVVGIIAGCFTFANAIFGTYVICVHPTYREHLVEEEKEKRARVGSPAPPSSGAAASVAVPMAATAASPAGNEDPFATGGGSGGDNWEKLWDENTQRHYYHNHGTGETRWDKP